MTHKDPLVSLDVSRRRQEEQKLKQTQQSVMDTERVERDTRQFNQSVNATNDKYMIDALTKVRESKVTHHEDLTRFNGTWMHNRSIKKWFRRNTTMQKYDYQTCIRLPTFLKDEMTTICDKYQINHSDLMRRAISEFVQTHTENTENNGKLMFVWYVR